MDTKKYHLELIYKYFPELSDKQKERYETLWDLYQDWNVKINVISRKDIDNLFLHHVMHSLSIYRFMRFQPGSQILDLGTGGGFPGIPLSIVMEDVKWVLIDGTKKKITVVQDVVEKLELEHVHAYHLRAEEVKLKFDYVVTRAVAELEVLLKWTRSLLSQKHRNSRPNGLIALKGGVFKSELKKLHRSEYTEVVAIQKYFNEPYFDEKYIVYVQG
ncbi:MAG TPA: 16S rRNA (guanine(527)-N(7))-methyltransferase RsmG [Saprospiraceae bacterium]|nr:16S rRNA (guanine(527)-N(7))-methyltransferase RsmG [Saprospiraceae bacterium]